MAELYVRYSHRNFTPQQWKEAAERFLELEAKINDLELQDVEINHEALYREFESCEICEQEHELISFYNDFAAKFAPIWAKEALQVVPHA